MLLFLMLHCPLMLERGTVYKIWEEGDYEEGHSDSSSLLTSIIQTIGR